MVNDKTCRIDEKTHRKLKIISAKKGITIKDTLRTMINVLEKEIVNELSKQ